MTTQDFNSMVDELKSRLVDINKTHLNSIPQPVFGGGTNDMDILNLDGITGNAAFKLVGADINNVTIMFAEDPDAPSKLFEVAQSDKFISRPDPVYITRSAILEMSYTVEQQIAKVKSIASQNGITEYNYISIWNDGGFRLYNIIDPSSIQYATDDREYITTNTYSIVQGSNGKLNYRFNSTSFGVNLNQSITYADLQTKLKKNIKEVNCIPLLYNNDNNDNFNTIMYMYALHALYAILNTSNWDTVIYNFKNNKSNADILNNISIFDGLKNFITINASEYIPYLLNIIDTQLLEQLINQTHNFNIFVARRIVYMWILMYNFSIAYNYSLQNPSTINNNLALVCLSLLISNNNTFKYNDALHDTVQESELNQKATLTYQLWCVVLQTIVPYTLGSLDVKSGTLSINNATDKCTNIKPELALNNLQNHFNNFRKNYDLIKPDMFNSIQNQIIGALGNYENTQTQCINSLNSKLYNDYGSLKYAVDTTNNNIGATKWAAQKADTAANTTKNDVSSTFAKMNSALGIVSTAEEEAANQSALFAAEARINEQLGNQGYALVKNGKYIMSPNSVYDTQKCCVVDMKQPIEQQLAQINSIVQQNGITKYNYVTIYSDGGFRAFDISNPSQIVYADWVDPNVTVNTFRVELSAVANQLRLDATAEAQIEEQLNTQGYALFKAGKYITNPGPLYASPSGVLDTSKTLKQKLDDVNSAAEGMSILKYNYVSMWDDGRFQIFNIANSGQISYQSNSNPNVKVNTYIVANTSIASAQLKGSVTPASEKNSGFSIIKKNAVIIEADGIDVYNFDASRINNNRFLNPAVFDPQENKRYKLNENANYTILTQINNALKAVNNGVLPAYTHACIWPYDVNGYARWRVYNINDSSTIKYNPNATGIISYAVAEPFPRSQILVGSTSLSLNRPLIPFEVVPNITTASPNITYTITFDLVYSTVPTDWQNILINGYDDNNNSGRHPGIWLTPTGYNGKNLSTIHFVHNPKNPNNYNVVGKIQLQLNVKNTITVIAANNTLYLYVNGVFDTKSNPVTDGVSANNPLVWQSTNTWFWSYWSALNIGLSVSNVHWWNIALTADQISAYYKTPSISIPIEKFTTQTSVLSTTFPKAQSLVGARPLQLNKLIPFTTVPNITTKNPDVTYTISFDLTYTTLPTDWQNIFINGHDIHQAGNFTARHPGVWLSPTGGGWPSLPTIHFVHNPKNPNNYNVIGKIQLQKNVKNTITLIAKNNTLYLFVNGVIDIHTLPNDWGVSLDNPLVWPSGNSWNWRDWAYGVDSGMSVSNVNWWNVALTAEQVKAYYQKPSIATTVEGFVAKQLQNIGANITNSERTLINDATTTVYSTGETITSVEFAMQISKAVETNLNSMKKTIDETYNTSVDLADLQQQTTNFYNATQAYMYMKTINRNPITNDALYDVKKSVSDNIYKYKTNQDSINYMGPAVKKNKRNLLGSQTLLTGRIQKDSTLNMYIYIELVILLIVTLSSIFIVMTSLPKPRKLAYTLLLALFVIVNLFLVKYVFNKTKSIETFTNNSDVSVSPIACMNAASEYILNTENITLLLESTNIYTNTNDSLGKELGYYTNVSHQLENKNNKVSALYKIYFIKQVRYDAIMELCNTLTLIIIGFTTIYIGLEALQLDFAYTWLYGITGTLIIIAAVICLIEVNIRVRSDPKQIYWVNPNPNNDSY